MNIKDEIERDINSKIPKELSPIIIRGKYGSGAYSTVYEITGNDRQLALRISNKKTTKLDDISLHEANSQYGMAPEILTTGKLTTGKNFIIMDPIAGDMTKYLRTDFNVSHASHAFKCLLDKKYVLGMLHGDMHSGNIAILFDGITLGFIDFDFSMLNVDPILTILDFIPLLGGMKKLRDNKRVVELMDYIIQYYQDTFNITIVLKKITDAKNGGYVYANKLNSYIKVDGVGLPKTTVEDIRDYFPTLNPPTIT